jgi:hypothetical protein
VGGAVAVLGVSGVGADGVEYGGGRLVDVVIWLGGGNRLFGVGYKDGMKRVMILILPSFLIENGICWRRKGGMGSVHIFPLTEPVNPLLSVFKKSASVLFTLYYFTEK